MPNEDWMPITEQSTSVTSGTDTPSVMESPPKQMKMKIMSTMRQTILFCLRPVMELTIPLRLRPLFLRTWKWYAIGMPTSAYRDQALTPQWNMV